MNWIRSKDFKSQINTIQQWIHTTTTPKYTFSYQTSVHTPASIWDDITVTEWLQPLLPLQSEIDFVSAQIKAPITDIKQLKQRQAILKTFNGKHTLLLSKELESDIQWFLGTPVINKNYLFNILFPGTWYLKWVKLHPELLRLYQWYSVYISTASSLMYPLSVLFGPYWVIRYKFGFPMTFSDYISAIYKLLRLFKNNLKQLVGIFVYIGFYIYSLIQNIDLAFQLHHLRTALLQKIQNIYTFIQRVKRISGTAWWAPFEKARLSPFNIKPNLYWVYQLLTKPGLQKSLFDYFKVAVIHDSLYHINKLNYTYIKYGDVTWFDHMRNPMLGKDQVSNPISLKKNLIVSGPNAGGKTTYVKSLLWSILLGQSFGIAACSEGQLKPYTAILHHHRVKDIVGNQSLFQAEMAKIKEALACIKDYSTVIYFMDEPLHSTHPIDGAAMLKALLYYLELQKNCSVVITSHYFSIQSLPNYYNVSVKAILSKDDILFDYKVYLGGSQQTIGIELLRKEAFPASILESAVKLKNKIYARTVI